MNTRLTRSDATVATIGTRQSLARKLLLVCGLLAALLWVGGDILASMRYPGYSYTDQAISELSAIGAPTRPFLMPILNLYSLLTLAFALGVWLAAGPRRGLRTTAGLLFALAVINVVLGLINLVTPLGAMHTRKELSQTGGSLSDTLHLMYAGVIVLSGPLMIGFSAGALGKRWRLYSILTILVLFVFGAWTALDAPRVAANLPTPWMGLRERINAYGYMLWLALLAVALWRAPATQAAGLPPTDIGSPQLTPY